MSTAIPIAPDLPTLPALKRLGKLADLRPVIIIDTREQTPLPIKRLETVRAGLQTADYSFQGGEQMFGIERKSIDDLVGCCMGENRERFEREMHRLRGFRFKRLLIVGPRWMIDAHRYKSKVLPKTVLHSLSAWEARYDLPVVFTEHETHAAEMVESWVWWFAREMVESTNSLLRGSRSVEPVPVPTSEPAQEEVIAP